MRLALALAAVGLGVALLVCASLWDSLGIIATPMILGLIGVDAYYAFFADKRAREARRGRR